MEQEKATPYNEYITREADEAKERIFARIESGITDATHARKVRMWQFAAAAAASVALLLAISDVYLLDIAHTPLTTVCPEGMVSVFALPDGTIVKLNAGSSLSYTTRFETAATRTVKLTGEALFEVAKDSMRPFIAETDCMSIEALGTVFNVKAYHDENEVVATLVEGSVKVTTPGRSPRILRPNEQLTYNRTARTASIANVNAPLYTLWADNQLYFNNERFDVILHILSRAYGVKITTRSQQLAASHYSGILSRKLDIQALLESLTQSRNFSLSKLEDSNEIEIIENK